MGFIESFIAWLVVIFIVAIILYIVFTYILGWFYPRVEEEENIGERQIQTDGEVEIEEQQNVEKKKRQRLIAVFIFVIMAILIGSGGVSAYMDTRNK